MPVKPLLMKLDRVSPSLGLIKPTLGTKLVAGVISNAILPGTQNGHLGPWTDGVGNLWTILHDASANLNAYKSVDGGDSWSIADSVTAPGNSTLTNDSFFDSAAQKIYTVVFQTGVDTLRVYVFDIATEALTQLSSGTSEPTIANDVNAQVVAQILKRSDGTFVIVYQGPKETVSATLYSRVSYVTMSATGVWGTPVQHDLGVAGNYNLKSAALGASDRVHWVYVDQLALLEKHHSLSSADVLDSAVTVVAVSGGGGHHYMEYDPTVGKLIFFGISGNQNAYRASSTAAPTWTVDTNNFTSVGADSSGKNALVGDGAGGIHAFYRGPGPVYHNSSTGTTWGTEAQFLPTIPSNHSISAELIPADPDIIYGPEYLGVIYGTSVAQAFFSRFLLPFDNYVETCTVSSTTTVISNEFNVREVPEPNIQPLLFKLSKYGKLRILARPQPASPDVSVGITYTDSTTISSVTSVQSSDSADFLDSSGTIQGTSAITSTEISQYVDSATISSTTSPSSTETSDYVDSSVVTSITVLTVQVETASINPPYERPLLFILSRRLGLLHNNILTPADSVRINYTESATITTVTSVQSSENADFLDTSGAIQGTSSITSTEIAQYTDAATVPGITSIIYTETADYIETAIIASTTTLTSVEAYVPFIQEPSHHPLLFTLNRIDGIRLLHNNILIPAVPVTGADYVESATIGSVTSLSAVETANYVDGSTLSSVTSLTSTEIAADVESTTASSVTSLSLVDTADYVDNSTVGGITSVTLGELFVPFVQEPSHHPLLITLERGGLRLLDNNILNPATPLTNVDYTDSATISSVTSVQASDSTDFLDTSGTVQGTSVVSSAELANVVEASTVVGNSSISCIELASYIESNTVTGSSSVTTTDTSDYIDANTVSGVTSVTSDEQYIPVSTIVANTTQAILIRLAKYHPKFRHLLGYTLYPVTHVPVDYVESQTISSTTSVTSTEISQFVDTATLPSVTSPSSTESENGSDSKTISGVTALSSTDVLAALDSNTVNSTSSITSVDVSAYVDFNTAGGTTSITSNDVGAYIDSSTLGTTTSIILTEQKISTDTGTVSGVTTVNYTEFANYVDGISVNNTTTVTADEEKSAGNSDFSTVTSTTKIISYEIGAFVRFALTAQLVGRRWSTTGYDSHYSCAGSQGRTAEIAGTIYSITKMGRRWSESLL